ncbi:hypothetical protein LCGC14_1880090 [marine sediment metagenome]|uniref:Cell wall hydrolase SleB domain-containing protein n=1 Tax=marine sediment metagenome TaxID=412755 RepID=A0A0F9J0Y2_9ZZZZ
MEIISTKTIIAGVLKTYLAFVGVDYIDATELECLATNVYFEARDQDVLGQRAVAHVTLNRVKSPNFPNTICDVVKQGLTYKNRPDLPKKDRCQFSWYCDGKSDNIRLQRQNGQIVDIVYDAYWTATVEALEVIAARSKDPTNGATYYFAHNLVQPKWAKSFKVVATIEDHTFMRPE